MPSLRSLRRPALLLLALAAAPALAQPAPPPDLGAFVDAVRDAFDVPGVAVTIVKDGQTVLAQGYGVRDLENPTPVDAHTLFGIASNSKAFTATALALLVNEGKLTWDTPVQDVLPAFRMADPYVTREMTVRDLLVHRSGLSLGAGDLLWWPPVTYTRQDVVQRLRHIPLATSFRSAFAYDNVLYMVAGEVVEAVGGAPWEDFVAERILRPLGMTETTTRVGEGLARPNRARPHARVEGVVRPVAAFDGENANPAAGIMTNARDVARWLTVQLDSGRVDTGVRLFPPATTTELWGLVTPMPISPFPPELAAAQPQFSGYALGFFVLDYRGHKVVTHTGGLPGYVSQITLVPDLGLGVAVFTNQESGAAFRAITNHVVDHYLGVSDTDWLAAYEAVVARQEAGVAAQEHAVAAGRDSLSSPSLPLAAYAGTYTDPWYGGVTITPEGGGLVMRFGHTPALVGDLEHWQHDTFVVRSDAFLTFALNPDGSVDQAKMQAVSPATDFSFDFQDLLLKPKAE